MNGRREGGKGEGREEWMRGGGMTTIRIFSLSVSLCRSLRLHVFRFLAASAMMLAHSLAGLPLLDSHTNMVNSFVNRR